ncbi:protein FAM53C-like [Stigmatopora nigra]
MVTLITEQLRKQSLEEPYSKAFNGKVTLPALGSSPTISWSACKSTQESGGVVGRPLLQGKSPPLPYLLAKAPRGSDASIPSRGSPPIPSRGSPPTKRHCPSPSVPEELSRCRSTWHPTASKVWTPVKRHSQSRRRSPSGAPRIFYKSSSSPTFVSLALSGDSPKTARSSSPTALVGQAALRRRYYSLSPFQVVTTSALSQHPRPLTRGRRGMECPASSLSPTSSSSSRRERRGAAPRCRSQPCDTRRPRLKRRLVPDVLPGPRPRLNFSKMTQIGNGDGLFLGGCGTTARSQKEQKVWPSPVEFLGRVGVRPLGESEEEEEDDDEEEEDGDGEEEEEEDDKMKRTVIPEAHLLFERDCTELDLNLIEEN